MTATEAQSAPKQSATCCICKAVISSEYSLRGLEMENHYKTHAVTDLIPVFEGWVLFLFKMPWKMIYYYNKEQMQALTDEMCTSEYYKSEYFFIHNPNQGNKE